MASDGIVLIFWGPMLVCLISLLASYFLIDKESAAPKQFTDIGWRRIILGLSGSMIGTVIYCCFTALLIGLDKVEQGHITYQDLLNLLARYCFYMFWFIGPIIMFGVSFIGTPVALLLTRLNFASHTGVLFASLIISATFAVYVLISPVNSWCESNPIRCATNNFSSVFAASATVALGFSLAARFPAWRNTDGKT
jgi:hypothetical protein